MISNPIVVSCQTCTKNLEWYLIQALISKGSIAKSIIPWAKIMLILSNVVLVGKHSHLEIFTFNITNQNMEIFHRNITIEKNSFVISARKSFWKNIGQLILGVESLLPFKQSLSTTSNMNRQLLRQKIHQKISVMKTDTLCFQFILAF